jgi:5-methylcytosine-specific restriction endonuclease McrA
MIKLDPPPFDAKAVYITCISRIRDPDLKRRLSSIAENVAEASELFDALASQTLLHQFVREGVIEGIVSTAEMESIYTQRMAKKKAPGRDVYDKLFTSAPNGKCALCGQRTVSTLDHHLPKSQYPILSVAPLNLVPACGDCNKAKLAKLPLNSSEESIHPYFDNIEDERWLFAKVIPGSPAAVLFYVKQPDAWGDVLFSRVESHFDSLNLNTLYSSESADEIINIRHQLNNMHIAGGKNLVKVELKSRAESCRIAKLNSWRTATYEAFIESDWFCDKGFNEF